MHAVTPHAALEQIALVVSRGEGLPKAVMEHAELCIDMSSYEVPPPPTTRSRTLSNAHLTRYSPHPSTYALAWSSGLRPSPNRQTGARHSIKC